VFQAAGIVVPGLNKKGETVLRTGNSHQTRRAMAEVLAIKCGLPKQPTVELTD
jgi:hypothetical protein